LEKWISEALSLTDKEVKKMLCKDFIRSAVPSLLQEYISPMLAVLDKPRKKFLAQTLTGILFSGSLVIKDMARWIHDDCSDIFYRIKRLTRHLISARGALTGALDAYRAGCNKYIEADTPISIDLTDLAKPRARKMKYLATVYDGSEDKLVNGYWCLEVYAQLSKKRIIPLALDAFSTDDPAVGSRNLQIDRVIKAVHKAVEGKGVWIADCGFDGLELYETWFSLKANFVVRQRGDRCVVISNGVRITQSQLVEKHRQSQMGKGRQTDIVFTKVRLPKRKEALYLVATWRSGDEKPLIIMTTMVVETIQQAKQILWYYRQRWSCEEAGRFLKNRIGLEKFCVRNYQALKRLMILAMFAMGFLTWILIRNKRLTQHLFALLSKFRKKRPFSYYRLLDGLQIFFQQHTARAEKIPILLLKNG
jgi:hypothetical protein